MNCVALVLLMAGQIPIVNAPGFPREMQVSATVGTVRIVNGTSGLQGSGAIIAAKDKVVYILTAKHVVAGALQLEISTYEVGSYPKPKAVYQTKQVVAEDEGKDLALVKIEVNIDKLAPLILCAPLAVPTKGDFKALAVGCGLGQEPTGLIDKVTGQNLYRRDEKIAAARFWEVDAKYAEGRSGGPLLDSNGNLLGVLSGTSNNKSYFSHTEEIRSFLKKAGL